MTLAQALFIAAAIVAGPAAAAPDPGPAPAQAIVPPRLLLDYCQAAPRYCGVEPEADPAAALPELNRRYWGAVRAVLADRASAEITSASASAVLPPGLRGELGRVNDLVNGAMTQRADVDTYGKPDVWRAPSLSGSDVFGDCEDFVLKKREMLIDAGAPPEALAIALVRTPAGEPHAVLLVATEDGVLALDNLEPEIRPWRDKALNWVQVQRFGDLFDWRGEPEPSAAP